MCSLPVWPEKGQLLFHIVEKAKIFVDSLIEEAVRSCAGSFEEQLENRSQGISRMLDQFFIMYYRIF